MCSVPTCGIDLRHGRGKPSRRVLGLEAEIDRHRGPLKPAALRLGDTLLGKATGERGLADNLSRVAMSRGDLLGAKSSGMEAHLVDHTAEARAVSITTTADHQTALPRSAGLVETSRGGQLAIDV